MWNPIAGVRYGRTGGYASGGSCTSGNLTVEEIDALSEHMRFVGSKMVQGTVLWIPALLH